MPGGDRTGPAGMGPMTGRAAGYCAGYPVPGYANPIPGGGGFALPAGRQGYGRGRGFGRGWGRGRGFGRGFGAGWGYPYGGAYPYADPYLTNPYAQEITPKQEADMLREQAKAMQEDIKSINSRINELESTAKAAKK
ncbi:MAG: DUF5320 domain-containing protein [Candidatus Omnitrophota bacterium]|nr:DUF5320 domain-containing protein [Candidatus Omnitrophota bacterium]